MRLERSMRPPCVRQDSFRLDEWGGFMKGCPAVALDTHVYQAWFDIRSQQSFLDNACSWRSRIYDARAAGGLPIIVGEWSLATDNCAMWLNGFHDDAPGYPKVVRVISIVSSIVSNAIMLTIIIITIMLMMSTVMN